MSTTSTMNTATNNAVDTEAFRVNVRELWKLKDEIEDLTRHKKELTKQHNDLQIEIIQQMQQLGKKSCNLRNGTFLLKETKQTKKPGKKAMVGVFEEALGAVKTSEIVERLNNAQESTVKTVLQRKKVAPTSESTVEQPAKSVAEDAA